MKVGGAAATTPLCGPSRGGAPATDDLRAKLADLEKRQLEELLKVAQTYGPKLALQLAQQLSGQAGEAKPQEIEGAKAASASGAQSSREDLEKLLEDILKKQETATVSTGAEGAGSQGQHQPPPMAQDVNLVQSRNLADMY